MKLRWPGFALVALTLLLWQCASTYGWVDTSERAARDDHPRFLVAGFWRMERCRRSSGRACAGSLSASVLAIAIGMPLGLLMGVNRLTTGCWSRSRRSSARFRAPPISRSHPVSRLGDQMKIFVITLACVFPILLNCYGGVKGIDPVLIDTGRTLGTPRFSILRKIVFPACCRAC